MPTITQVEAVKEAVNDIRQRNVTILTPDQTSINSLGFVCALDLLFAPILMWRNASILLSEPPPARLAF